jgi:hyaluronan synthase
MLHNRRAHLAILAAVVAALAAVTLVVHWYANSPVLIGYWWVGALVIAACLAAFIKGRRYTHLPPAEGRVLAIIPAYNEDPEALRVCVQSMLDQTRPVDAIIVVDDGSAEPVISSVTDDRVHWIRQENTGKRGAQVAALRLARREDWEYILTVDSDSELFPTALKELLRAMSEPSVQAATGMIYVRNYQQNILTRAADIDIGSSCVMMRASRSMLGALETTSGALALYRSDLLYDHLDAYAVECGTGDDRWLALRALERGEVVAVAEALVRTDMPPTLRATFKQRLRWSRSWFWMIPYVLTRLSNKQILSPVLGMIQLAVTPLLVAWIALVSVIDIDARLARWHVLALYVGAYLVLRFAVSGMYLVDRCDMPRGQKLVSWLVGTPAAILLNVGLLTPTRYYSLMQLGNAQWSNREVQHQGAKHRKERGRYRLEGARA